MNSALVTPAPAAVVAAGRPAFGAYRGSVPAVRWEALAAPFARGSLYRRTHAKAWHYASVVSDRLVCALAIIDVGIASSAFVYVFDRASRALLADRSWTSLPGRAIVSPQPTVGASSRFASGKARLAIDNLAGGAGRATRYRLRVDDSELHLEAELARDDDATLCAIVPIEGGVANCTHKSVGFTARGEVQVGATTLAIDGFGALDHTAGLLARDTRWRWASATTGTSGGARVVGLNLVEGFNGPAENVLWIGSQIVPVGAVRFDYRADDVTAPWRIASADGRLALTFTPEGARRQDKDLLLAKSWYVQPFGVFVGTFQAPDGPIAIGPLVGVTEDHRALW